jgi:hypothetical protein
LGAALIRDSNSDKAARLQIEFHPNVRSLHSKIEGFKCLNTGLMFIRMLKGDSLASVGFEVQ